MAERKIIAVVGATGSGKTTLTALVPRLYDVTAGRITIELPSGIRLSVDASVDAGALGRVLAVSMSLNLGGMLVGAGLGALALSSRKVRLSSALLASAVLWILIVPTLAVIVGLLVAVLADRLSPRAEKISKSVIFLPMAISFVGASVTFRATVTNTSGEYSLTAPQGAATLVFSMIGYAAQQVALEGRTVVNAALVANPGITAGLIRLSRALTPPAAAPSRGSAPPRPPARATT